MNAAEITTLITALTGLITAIVAVIHAVKASGKADVNSAKIDAGAADHATNTARIEATDAKVHDLAMALPAAKPANGSKPVTAGLTGAAT